MADNNDSVESINSVTVIYSLPCVNSIEEENQIIDWTTYLESIYNKHTENKLVKIALSKCNKYSIFGKTVYFVVKMGSVYKTTSHEYYGNQVLLTIKNNKK